MRSLVLPTFALAALLATLAPSAAAVQTCVAGTTLCVWVIQPPNACTVDVRSIGATVVDLCITGTVPTQTSCDVRLVYGEDSYVYLCTQQHAPQFGMGTCTLVYVATDSGNVPVIDLCQ